jgi:hypothetical protein
MRSTQNTPPSPNHNTGTIVSLESELPIVRRMPARDIDLINASSQAIDDLVGNYRAYCGITNI